MTAIKLPAWIRLLAFLGLPWARRQAMALGIINALLSHELARRQEAETERLVEVLQRLNEGRVSAAKDRN